LGLARRASKVGPGQRCGAGNPGGRPIRRFAAGVPARYNTFRQPRIPRPVHREGTYGQTTDTPRQSRQHAVSVRGFPGARVEAEADETRRELMNRTEKKTPSRLVPVIGFSMMLVLVASCVVHVVDVLTTPPSKGGLFAPVNLLRFGVYGGLALWGSVMCTLFLFHRRVNRIRSARAKGIVIALMVVPAVILMVSLILSEILGVRLRS